MRSLVLISLVTMAASLMLTLAVRAIARKLGVVDRPDGRRKLHDRPIPLWGGLAVYSAAVLGLLAVRFSGASAELADLSTVWIITAGFVCFLGGIDDRFDLPSRLKLVLQIVSVLPVVFFGHYVDRIVAFGYPIELGWLGIPLTVLWLVGCINALNLIDGMDGLASIVGLSAAAMMGIIAASEGRDHVAVMAMVLAASLLGFLIYNLPPASVFLGDSGSMVLGLSVGLLGIQGNLKTSATLAITAPAVVMTLPMFDIFAALVRRKLTGRRFDAPDRLHIHHRLLDRGWTPWQVLCLIGAVCLTTGAAATAATILRRDALAWITAVSLVVLMIRLRLFGYEEFALAKGALVRARRSCLGFLAGLLRRRGALDSGLGARERPDSSIPPIPILWDILLRNVRTWDIRQVEFRSLQDHQSRRIRWIDPAASADGDCRWSISVSLPAPDGEFCELRASSAKPIVDQHDLATLTSLLKTFGAHFAAHAEQLFGPPAVAETYSDHQRKAA
jgi:UDP-GlcNAc:undecaprenyl-phosphate GlcNAc-1-phosphate transferase